MMGLDLCAACTAATLRLLPTILAIGLATSIPHGSVSARPARPLRQHLSIVEHLEFQDSSSTRSANPRIRTAPLECLGRSVHPPWQNPFTPLTGALAARHQRLTVSPGPAAVEFGDALLIQPGERFRFQLVPKHDARLEFAYRVYRCGETGPLDLRVTIDDALGTVTSTHPLAVARTGQRTMRESGFTDLVIDLPVAAGMPFQLTLEVVARQRPDTSGRRGRKGPKAKEGGLVALVDPTLSSLATDPTPADTNVLWIVIDAVRHDAMGPGRTFARSASPELDRRVFARGTSFSQAYALANQTRTSTVAMLASVPASIGGFHSHSWSFTSGKRETFYERDPELVTRVLQRHGFLTRHIGHNHFIWGSEVIGIDHGFQRALDIRAIPQDAIEASRAAVRFVTRHQDSRWMMMLNYTAPHTPYKPPEEFLEKARALTDPPSSERIGMLPRTYLGEILWVDHNLEQVFETLENLELLDNTLVIVTADHGEVMNMAHDCASALLEQPCAYNHGVTVYDDELRVPLVFALPSRLNAGRVIDTPVSHADLAPTILDVLGLAAARGHVGRSLLAALTGGQVEAQAIYADGRLAAALRLGDLKLIVHAAKDDIRPRPRMVAGEPSRYELFDLASDPLELDNLALVSPELIPFVTAELDGLRARMRSVFEGRLHSTTGATETGPGQNNPQAQHNYHLMLMAQQQANATAVVSSKGTLSCRSQAPLCRSLTSHSVELRLDAGATPQTATFIAGHTDSLEINALLSGSPWPTQRLRLGPWGLAMLKSGQAISGEVLTWLETRVPPIPQPRESALYLFRDPASPTTGPTGEHAYGHTSSPEDLVPELDGDAALGGEVKRILKDLGYTR